MRAVMIALGLLALAGCADKPTTGQCEELLDHVLDLELKQAGGDAPKKRDLDFDAQKKKVKDYVHEEFVDYCVHETPKRQINCALKAKSLGELAECDKT